MRSDHFGAGPNWWSFLGVFSMFLVVFKSIQNSFFFQDSKTSYWIFYFKILFSIWVVTFFWNIETRKKKLYEIDIFFQDTIKKILYCVCTDLPQPMCSRRLHLCNLVRGQLSSRHCTSRRPCIGNSWNGQHQKLDENLLCLIRTN